jgi:nucleoside-diphosphate-sugar epimerase
LARRVLVTGGTGFVGQHVVPNLLARGFDVTVAARQTPAIGLAGAGVVSVGDLRSNIDWNRHLEGMDTVVHLAALAHITSDIPESDYDQINRRATSRLAKAASANGVRLIFASSVAAQCGPSADRTLTEEDEPYPTTAYGRSKLRAEQEIKEVSSNFVILRPTLIYGTGVIGNMQRLVRLAMSRVPPPFSLVANRRSLLAVENMYEAIYFVLNSNAATNKTFLLADREPVSTSDLVTQLRLGAGLNATQIPVPPVLLRTALQLLGRGDMWDKIAGNLVASVAKLEAIGFQWRTKTREGLYALGEFSRSKQRKHRLANGSLETGALIKK